MLEFKKKSLNKSFTITSGADVVVIISACEKHSRYNGRLSNISETAILDGMIERGSNLIARKVKPAKAEEEVTPQ